MDSPPEGGTPRWALAGAELLAERHREAAPPDPERSVLNAAEAPREGDWSLRSALVRLAQPEPVRAGGVLGVVRRCESALRPRARLLERHTVWCQPSLSPDHLVRSGHRWHLADGGPRRADTRCLDLVNLAGSDPDRLHLLVDAYDGLVTLDPGERTAIDLLAVAAAIDQLAAELTNWALTTHHPPPLDRLDRLTIDLGGRLDELGVAPETGPETGPETAEAGERGRPRRRTGRPRG